MLFDAAAFVLCDDGTRELANEPTAHDFVTDAHAHCKFVGLGPNAATLLAAAGVDDDRWDDGYVTLGSTQTSATAFIETCRDLRRWDRSSTA